MKTNVAIVGGGPGGTATAMFLSRFGISSTIVERETFPRFHIGESLSGECGNLLRTLGLEDKMTAHQFPVKRGVRVFGRAATPWMVPVMARSPEGGLVPQSTWQVRRAEFDAMMLDEALGRGANIVRGTATEPIREQNGAIRGVRVTTESGGDEEIESDVLVDASGQRTWLAHQGVTGPKLLGRYRKQVAVFSHVKGALRDAGTAGNDTLIFYQERDHWAWFIPLSDEVVSVGVVIPGDYLASTGETKRDFLLRELHELNPNLRDRIFDIELVEETRAIPDYSYEVSDFTGPGFICIGDAHRFIDPIFSFGAFFTIKEAQLAATAIHEYLAGNAPEGARPFAAHERLVNRGTDAIQDLIDGFWAEPLAFGVFAHQRYREDVIDLFAGRVYSEESSRGREAIRRLAERGRAADLTASTPGETSELASARAPVSQR